MRAPVWAEIQKRRVRLRKLVISYGSTSTSPELGEIIREVIGLLEPAMADEMDAFTWGDGEEYHLIELKEMEVLYERMKNNLRRFRKKTGT